MVLQKVVEDFAKSKVASILLLSKLRPVVNSRRVLALDEVAGMS